ncbi:MAG: TetR/AcrR family transcriptional regulator, partial [Bacteroidales bacterium]|nr:TetR/AcrR family transcriptional regulator [Bacteroidales bacterium]
MKTLDENITTKASKLFKQYGIRGISMDDISREVGISKKTLYRYIEDKNELVQSACDKEIKSVNDQFSS